MMRLCEGQKRAPLFNVGVLETCAMSTESTLSPQELFDWAGLAGHGPFPWREAIKERGSGIYIITASHKDEKQEIVYIGRAKQLNKRLRQFFRHIPGNRRPHKGGETIIHLLGTGQELQIYYATCDNHIEFERIIINKFEEVCGIMPYGNKKRGDLLSI
ncbi:MAG: GIY-YIG nuclease family protein [Gluconobacter sp.]|uniref:GIY-YIG nuclease family protein n=1 Tax=Gluconobacter sp. TaxID=1876758 RepID=UPI0039EA2ECE